MNHALRTRLAATAATAAVGAAALSLHAPSAHAAGLDLPELPPEITQLLPQQKDLQEWSDGYDDFLAAVAGQDVQDRLSAWNSFVEKLPAGFLPSIRSVTEKREGKPGDSSGTTGLNFKDWFERDEMSGIAGLIPEDMRGLLPLAELLQQSKGLILHGATNSIVLDADWLSGTHQFVNEFGYMPPIDILGITAPSFTVWIPQVKGQFESVFGSGFGYDFSLPTIGLEGLGGIGLPHLKTTTTLPFGLGGTESYFKTQMIELGEDGAIKVSTPSWGHSLDTLLGEFAIYDNGAALNLSNGLDLQDGLSLISGTPTFSFTDTDGNTHSFGFSLGELGFDKEEGLIVKLPGIVTGDDLADGKFTGDVELNPVPEPEEPAEPETPEPETSEPETPETTTVGSDLDDTTDDSDGTADEPSTSAPVEAPEVDQPVEAAPSETAPVEQAPVVEAPTADEPAVDEPTVDEPTVEAPALDGVGGDSSGDGSSSLDDVA